MRRAISRTEALVVVLVHTCPAVRVAKKARRRGEPVEMFIYGTGFNVDDGKEHLGTIQDGSFVWHLFRTKK